MKALALVALLLALSGGTAYADYDATDGGGAAMPQILVTSYNLLGTTASGTQVGPGVAACPPDMRFGTRLHLSGKVELDVRCEDRYGYWLSRRVDVWTRYYREAIAITGIYSYSFEEGQS